MPEPGRSQRHDPGDPECVEHVKGAIYTAVVHRCRLCREPQRSQRYGCKDKPGAVVVVTMPEGAETPAQIEVRYPNEDYRGYVFWWHDAPPVDASKESL